MFDSKPIQEISQLRTFDELLYEETEAKKDPKYEQYKAEYYGAFAIPENLITQDCLSCSKFDCKLLERQLMNKPFVNQRININPIDDASVKDIFITTTSASQSELIDKMVENYKESEKKRKIFEPKYLGIWMIDEEIREDNNL